MLKNLDKISDRRLSFILASIVLTGTLILFIPVIMFSIFQVVKQGEIRGTQQEVHRADSILQNEITRLDQYLLDWSAWDDTYQFAQDVNPTYIEGNLADSSFLNLGIDAFITLDAQGKVVYVKYVDRQAQAEAPLPFDVDALLADYPQLKGRSDLPNGIKGLAARDNLVMLAASRPILTSLKEGPPSGTLIWLHLLDPDALANLSKLASRELDMYAGGDLAARASGLPAPDVVGGGVFVQAVNDQTILGYRYFDDLNGRPSVVLRVQNDRDLYQQGRSTALIFTGVLLVIGLLLFAGAYNFTNMFLTSRRTGRKYLQRFQTIVHQSREAILLVSPDFRLLEANPASRELLALPPDQDTSGYLRGLLSFEPDLDEERVLNVCQNGQVSEHLCMRHDGARMEIELSASQINDPDMRAYSLILRDVTARKKAEKALKASEERYMLAANGANDGLWDWNLINGRIYYSPRWKAMLGLANEEVQPQPDEWLRRIHPDDRLLVETQLASHLRNQTENFACEYRIQVKDGSYRWMLARGVAVWDSAGFASRIAGSQTDINDRKTLEEQFRHDALHDSLTGLGNRTVLIDHLHHVNERKRRKPDLLFALFFMDFDRFKQINDTLGHQAGDQLLIEASRRLQISLRATDTITRFAGAETLTRIAGDEFVLLLEDFHVKDDILKVGERINRLMNAPYHLMGQEVILTASIGVVVPEIAYANVEDIIRDADIAMYRAKQLGGAQIVQFDQEMYNGTIARMQLESDLRKAVEHREFEVFYQPIYTLDDDHISGFEALVRWNHPTRGLLMPDSFIKAAEDIGMIIPIGLFVLEESCRRMQTWRKEHRISPDLMVSVNFSARQIVAGDLLEQIHVILEQTGFDPHKLWLEVTESTLLQNNDLVLARLNDLRALGIRIEIDDFGTGYSSLSYLQQLPVDGFKIDRSFIKDIQGGGQKIVKTLIELGHSLGLTEVAEGVETEHQKEYLKQMECQYAQGYLMARPVSASGIEDLLEAQHKGLQAEPRLQ